VICDSCGLRIDAQDPYCRWCGTRQGVVPAVAPVTGPASSRSPLSGPEPGVDGFDPPPPPGSQPRAQRTALVAGVAVLVALLVAGIAVVGGSDRGTDRSDDVASEEAGSPPAIGAAFPPPPTIDPPPSGWNPETIAASFGDAVWRVEVSGCGLESGGTAFAISPHHLVTNWHVVVLDTEPDLVSRSGDRTLNGHVIGLQKQPDLALIEVDEPLPQYLEWDPTGSLSEGQELVAIGYPRPQGNFTVTQLRISSFEQEGDLRSGILAFGAVDRGNSGGPSFSLDGKVAGINTRVNINSFTEGGLQTVPYLVSADAALPVIERFLENAGGATAPTDCSKVDPKQAKTYGDNEMFDDLWDRCDAGDAVACDALARYAPAQTDYYVFGVTCGQRVPREGYCSARYGEQLWPK
jgi:S1-C subfamily serine protease